MMLSGVYCRKCQKSGPMTVEEHSHIECRCNGQEHFNTFGWRESLPYPQERCFPKNCRDEDGYSICKWCGLIEFPNRLVTCTECSDKFKGPRPNFPIDFECPKCEERILNENLKLSNS